MFFSILMASFLCRSSASLRSIIKAAWALTSSSREEWLNALQMKASITGDFYGESRCSYFVVLAGVHDIHRDSQEFTPAHTKFRCLA